MPLKAHKTPTENKSEGRIKASDYSDLFLHFTKFTFFPPRVTHECDRCLKRVTRDHLWERTGG